jgi:hypothetical protein
MGLGGQRHAPATLPSVKTQYPLYRRLGGPQCRSGRVRKISPPRGFDSRTAWPLASRYSNWAIPVSTVYGTCNVISHVERYIIIIIIITISFMQGIYTHIPETNHVPKEYNVAAILSLLFMVPISLVRVLTLMYFYFSTFRSIIIIIISSTSSWLSSSWIWPLCELL